MKKTTDDYRSTKSSVLRKYQTKDLFFGAKTNSQPTLEEMVDSCSTNTGPESNSKPVENRKPAKKLHSSNKLHTLPKHTGTVPEKFLSSESSTFGKPVPSHNATKSMNNTTPPRRTSNNKHRSSFTDDPRLSSVLVDDSGHDSSHLMKRRRRLSPTLQRQAPPKLLKRQAGYFDTPKGFTQPFKPFENESDQSSSTTSLNKDSASGSESPQTTFPSSYLSPASTKSSEAHSQQTSTSISMETNSRSPSSQTDGEVYILSQQTASCMTPNRSESSSVSENASTTGSTTTTFSSPTSSATTFKDRKRTKKATAKRLQKVVESQKAFVKNVSNNSPTNIISRSALNPVSGLLHTELLPEFLIDPLNDINDLTIADLRDLVLYLMTPDFRAPTWVGVKQNFAIPRVVSIYIPSLTYLAFNEGSDDEELPSIDINSRKPQPFKAPEILDFFNNTFSHAFVVSCPGNRNVVFSPTDSFLWMMPNQQEKKLLKMKGDSRFSDKKTDFRNSKRKCTPLDLILSLDELIQHKYPIHPDTVGAKLVAASNPSILHELGSDWVSTEFHTPEMADFSTNRNAHYKLFAIDCEMCKSYDVKVLTRVTVVAENGQVVIDELVKPAAPITDYVTQFSGITKEMLENVYTRLSDVQEMIRDLVSSHDIMIGHSLENDLEVLKMRHPRIIDTAVCFQNQSPGHGYFNHKPALRNLTKQHLKRHIQTGGSNGHDSAEDALACLDLVKLKLQHGIRFGIQDGTTKISLADRLSLAQPKNGSGISAASQPIPGPKHQVAVVDYGVPIWASSSAQTIVSCTDDDEVVRNVETASLRHGFTWARMRELELLSGTGKNPRKSHGTSLTSTTQASALPADAEESSVSEPSALTEPASTEKSETEEAKSQQSSIPQPSKDLLNKAYSQLNSRLKKMYANLPTNTAVIIWTGQGDKRRMMELNAQRHRFNHEYKTKKWSEIKNFWTEENNRELSKSIEKARKGLAFLVVKRDE